MDLASQDRIEGNKEFYLFLGRSILTAEHQCAFENQILISSFFPHRSHGGNVESAAFSRDLGKQVTVLALHRRPAISPLHNLEGFYR